MSETTTAIRNAINSPDLALDDHERDGIADRVLAALEDAGLAVVPVEPTEEMLDAGQDGRRAASRASGVFGQTVENTMRYEFRYERSIWSAMLAAAKEKP